MLPTVTSDVCGRGPRIVDELWRPIKRGKLREKSKSPPTEDGDNVVNMWRERADKYDRRIIRRVHATALIYNIIIISSFLVRTAEFDRNTRARCATEHPGRRRRRRRHTSAPPPMTSRRPPSVSPRSPPPPSPVLH